MPERSMRVVAIPATRVVGERGALAKSDSVKLKWSGLPVDLRLNASCKGTSWKVFFPRNQSELAFAQRICLSCTQRETCLKVAQANRETGVWGGLNLDRGRVTGQVSTEAA